MHHGFPTERDRRRDSRDRYKGYPYANKKYFRTRANRRVRRLPDVGGGYGELHKAYELAWKIW